ncbi:MAG: phosphoribosylanthranilate isomerase [Saprospiraceae bacterium]
MTRIRVKICCISSIEEALTAIKCGASAIGLVGNMPSGPGVIDDNLISEISKIILPPISSFLLTSETKASKIIEHYKKVYTSTIQIVDELEGREYEKLRKELPNVKLVQVIHVIDDKSIEEALEISKFVDAILLDSGNPNLKIKELGGTGRTHNWELSKRIRKGINIPLFLAGGINKHNVKKAIEIVQPFGIDLCSSVRTNGKLDERKLEELFDAIN